MAHAIPRGSINGSLLNLASNPQKTEGVGANIKVDNGEKAKSIFSRIWNWVVKFFSFIKPGAGQDAVNSRNTQSVSVVVPSPEDNGDGRAEEGLLPPPPESSVVIKEEISTSSLDVEEDVVTPQTHNTDSLAKNESQVVTEGDSVQATLILTSPQISGADSAQPSKKKKPLFHSSIKSVRSFLHISGAKKDRENNSLSSI